jgi:energy-coupling factor transporter ATP-binding protein EcfA2
LYQFNKIRPKGLSFRKGRDPPLFLNCEPHCNNSWKPSLASRVLKRPTLWGFEENMVNRYPFLSLRLIGHIVTDDPMFDVFGRPQKVHCTGIYELQKFGTLLAERETTIDTTGRSLINRIQSIPTTGGLMKTRFISKRRSRKGSVSFNPNRQFIAEAVQEYLKQGGKINQLKPDENTLKNSWMIKDVNSDVDEFLIGS